MGSGRAPPWATASNPAARSGPAAAICIPQTALRAFRCLECNARAGMNQAAPGAARQRVHCCLRAGALLRVGQPCCALCAAHGPPGTCSSGKPERRRRWGGAHAGRETPSGKGQQGRDTRGPKRVGSRICSCRTRLGPFCAASRAHHAHHVPAAQHTSPCGIRHTNMADRRHTSLISLSLFAFLDCLPNSFRQPR